MEQNTISKRNSSENLTIDKPFVGANALAHFNIRCPACDKLFRIDSREIKSSSPQFDCSVCKTRFTFDSPSMGANDVPTRTFPSRTIQTRIVQTGNFQVGNISTKTNPMGENFRNPKLVSSSADGTASTSVAGMKACPKCATQNPRLVKECQKCGVLFGRLENLSLETSLGAFPSLVKAWQDLMSDYSNIKKHLAFVDRCEDLQALPFALKKYETLREVQPTDKLAQKMFHQVFIRNLSRRADAISWIFKAKQFLFATSNKINWQRVRKLAPFALSLALIIVGVSNHSARNMAGMGAALLFLTIGLTVFLKGRISLGDFW